MIALMLECLGETFALVRKSGIDPHLHLEVLTGSLFAAPVYRTYGSMIVDEKFQPAGFKMSLALKDIRLALAAACPSSDNLRLIRLFAKGGSGSSGVRV